MALSSGAGSTAAEAAGSTAMLVPPSFEATPDSYRHLRLDVSGPVAWIKLDIQEHEPLVAGYLLKLNSYDLGVDIELHDAIQRLRFEHPQVGCVVITSAKPGVFSAGANIFMLGSSSHSFKVNFCKYTNETRLAIEDASAESDQVYVAALNGLASGGGYELALACQEIYLVNDRKSAVALPELPYLGVLPGTGGLTRLVDKRKVRRDLADLFCTLAEGVKGSRAVDWGLCDGAFAPSTFQADIEGQARRIGGAGHPERTGIRLEPLAPVVSEGGVEYRHLRLRLGEAPRTAVLEIDGPNASAGVDLRRDGIDGSFYPLRVFRELDDALLRLRFHYLDVGLVLVRTRGDLGEVLALDERMAAAWSHWAVREVLLLQKRVLKRMDLTAKSFFALVDEGSCFGGSLLELALAADRAYMKGDAGVKVGLSSLNFGGLPMGNGQSRLATRFLARPQAVSDLRQRLGAIDAKDAEGLGLVTRVVEPLDWSDEVRLACEERASLSPDALTGMEASLRFAGPETIETKIFGRLSAWQNWIFQRPNAVGDKGALTLYGRPESPLFDWRRT
jgi:benzoyl-CoA-dihydrodiol lyase